MHHLRTGVGDKAEDGAFIKSTCTPGVAGGDPDIARNP